MIMTLPLHLPLIILLVVVIIAPSWLQLSNSCNMAVVIVEAFPLVIPYRTTTRTTTVGLFSTMSNHPPSHSFSNDDNENHIDKDQQKQQQQQQQHQYPSNNNRDEYRSIEFQHLDSESSFFSKNNTTYSSSTTSSSSSSSSSLRKDRLQREYNTQQQFVPHSNALWELREKCHLLQQEIEQYRQQIQQLERQQYPVRPFLIDRRVTLENKLHQLQQQDPEYVYHTSIQQLQLVRHQQQQLLLDQQQQQSSSVSSSSFGSKSGTKLTPRQMESKLQKYATLLEQYQTQITAAKSCLPQYNYHGLWIGRYSSSHTGNSGDTTTDTGYDLINVTYVQGNDYYNDMLIATKVTSFHGNVPHEEITFQVPLYPITSMTNNNPTTTTTTTPSSSSSAVLPPIPLSPNAASKWGISQLSRFYGYGQVAEHHYQNHHWVPGQFIVINANYFSFAWLPTTTATTTSTSGSSSSNNEPQQTQIFFGRPSPELVLKLLAKKNTANSDNGNDDVMRNHNKNAMYDKSNVIHPMIQQPSLPQPDEKKKDDHDNKRQKSNAAVSKQGEEDDYEFPSITAATRSNRNTIQYQREYASRCLDLTY